MYQGYKFKILFLVLLMILGCEIMTFYDIRKSTSENYSLLTVKLKDSLKQLVAYNISVDIHDNDYCNVNCLPGVPCEYSNEVDFRIIVLTYNRPLSLQKTLNSILHLDTLNDRIAVEIWIDRSKNGLIDENTLHIANQFAGNFTSLTRCQACVHPQKRNTNIRGQWIDTWRPKEGTSELGLILEDDICISPKSYKWVKQLHKKYGHFPQVAGYTLQMENINFFGKGIRKMSGPPNQAVFLYPVLGTWGYAPHPKAWRAFQDWYNEVRPGRNRSTDKIKPYVPNIVPTGWYQSFEKRGTQESMWEMWHIKFAYEKSLFTIYSNLNLYAKNKQVLLSNNRREKGLHFAGNSVTDNSKWLLQVWDKRYEDLPSFENLAHFNYDGKVCSKTCCFNATC